VVALDHDAPPLVILDTLGRVMPPAGKGEGMYERDYRVGVMLKALVDAVPGAALVTNHHDRKAVANDFVERVSGSNGLAGSADTIIVITRDRIQPTGVINVTGRDVAEGAYAVKFDGNAWHLEGDDLAAAASAVQHKQMTGGLDERAITLLTFVNDRGHDVTAKDVVRAMPDKFMNNDDAGKYLRRLAEAGRLVKVGRGTFRRVPKLWVPPEQMVVPI
jgi:hypothetical protein